MRRLLLLGALAMSACANGAADAPTQTLASGGLPLDELPQQSLGKGQCGLFLWARTEPARRVFMSLDAPAIARVRLPGRTVELARSGTVGDAVFGHYPEERYAAPGVALTARIDIAPRGVVGGAVVPAGSLTYEDVAGESTVIPVVGLIACQS